MSSGSSLTDLILEDRVKGLSYYDIEKKHGIDALEARELVHEALSKTAPDDEWEQRGIALLRLERVVDHMWEGVESGSFKHAEAMFKGLDQIANLLALNKQVMETQKAQLTDEQAEIVFMVINENNRQILEAINRELKPNKTQLKKLEEWPQITADAATSAVEAVIYEGEMEDDE